MTFELLASESELRKKFFDLTIPEDIANLLELKSYDYVKHAIYIVPKAKRYTRFEIPKKQGGIRIIEEPHPKLKIIQKKLSQVLQAVYQRKRSVHGFVQRYGIVSNAKVHLDSKYVFNLDLENFFPSINFGRVRGLFMAAPYNLDPSVATVLAQICCHKNRLPQGSPTSPIISNMICSKMDSQLQKLAMTHRCKFTRYVDDLTFSTNTRIFPAALAIVTDDHNGREVVCGEDLVNIIENNGFWINPKKVRLQTRNRRQAVTGLVVNNKEVNVKRSFIRQIRMMLHVWKKYRYAEAERDYHSNHYGKTPDKPYKSLPSYQQVVKGKIEFVGMVRGRDDQIYIKLNNGAATLERRDKISPYFFKYLREKKDEFNRDELKSLRNKITDAFNVSELRIICFDMGFEHEDFPSEKNEFVLELIRACDRRKIIGKLLTEVREKRPKNDWELN